MKVFYITPEGESRLGRLDIVHGVNVYDARVEVDPGDDPAAVERARERLQMFLSLCDGWREALSASLDAVLRIGDALKAGDAARLLAELRAMPPHPGGGPMLTLLLVTTPPQLECKAARPATLAPDLDAVPEALRDAARWVVWRHELVGGEWKKVPCQAARPAARAKSNDASTWADFDTARRAYEAGGLDGVGFVLGDGWAGADFDDCLDAAGNVTDADVAALVLGLGSYTEMSPSGTGLKLFARDVPAFKNARREGLEAYSTGRYFTVTGRHHAGTPRTIEPRGAELARFAAAVAGAKGGAPAAPGNRNNHFTSLAGDLRRKGCSEKAILAALVVENARLPQPLPEREVEAIARSVARYAPAADHFKLTDKGNAEFFAAHFADRVRFDHRQARWLVFAGHRWAPDADGAMMRCAMEAVEARHRIALDDTAAPNRQERLKWATRSESRGALDSALALARNLPPIADAGDGWDAQPHLLGAPNGVIDLRTGRLHDGQPGDRVTMRVGVDYVPGARSALWEDTLRAIFPHEGLPAFVQRALGYSATGETALDKWFMMNGTGRNGKGTVVNAVRRALGDYTLELPASIFDARKTGAPFDLAKLPCKRFVTSSEAGDITLNHDRIKQLSGGDSQRAADKYQRSFEFDPVCKLWLACNQRPRARDESVAFWTRVLVVPFTVTFAGKEDTGLRDKLKLDPECQRAVLAWLVEGAVAYYAGRSLGAVPEAVTAATTAYEMESDRLADFYEACCMFHGDAKAKASDLRDAYVAWARANAIDYLLGSKTFYQAVARRAKKKTEERDGSWYHGIGLREDRPCASGPPGLGDAAIG